MAWRWRSSPRANKTALSFEAAVAGGIPIVKTLREGLGGSRINRIYGILNGTCNYILTRMQKERLSFADCLKEAQKLGYAEADPTFDIGGFDTAHKIAILTSLAFGTEVDAEAVHVEGIESISLADLETADELGYRVKLLGVAQRTDAGIEQRVHPTMVPQGTVIAEVDGVLNAVAVDADTMELTLMGPGAGGAATSSSVVADLMDLAAGRRVPSFGRPAAKPDQGAARADPAHEGGYYIRLAAVDRPGTAATIARRMAEAEYFAGIDHAARPRPAAAWRRRPAQRGQACAGRADHLCYNAKTRCAGRWRPSSRTACWRRSRR